VAQFSTRTRVEAGFGDVFGAVEDRADRGLADQPGQAADASGGALVEAGREAGECPGPVRVQVEGGFDSGDQLFERFTCAEPCGERPALDQRGPLGELRSAYPGEQRCGGHVDARVHERRPDAFGEVLQQVGGFGAGGGTRVEAVDLVDFTDRRSS